MPSGTLRVRRRSLGAVVRIGYLLVGVYGGGVFAGAARGSRGSQFVLNSLCGRVRDPFRVLERRHGLVEIVERGAGVIASVSRPTRSPEASTLAAVWICRGR